jgi:hypothetical protein
MRVSPRRRGQPDGAPAGVGEGAVRDESGRGVEERVRRVARDRLGLPELRAWTEEPEAVPPDVWISFTTA